MTIEKENYIVRPWRLSDAPSLAQSANNIRVWQNVRDGFPNPYTEADAVAFITMSSQADPVTNFAIVVDGAAVGGIGWVPHGDVERFSAEFGYWLAEPLWGRGIMSAVVNDFVDFVFAKTDIVRLYAGIFAFNEASGRVLEKAGFRRVGTLEKAAFKNGRFTDKILYEQVKKD